jgi:hypothetical protein
MARQQPAAREQSRPKRDKREADSRTGKDGHEEETASYEEELAGYLQERIRPGLNRGAIPLLARSIAKEIAHREHPNGTSEDAEVDDEDTAEAEGEPAAEADDAEGEPTAEADDAEAEDEEQAEADDERAEADDEQGEADDEQAEDEPASAFEDEMHELQAELGEDWILRFSVQGDDAWLTAEKDDGSQRVEAPTAEVLVEAVELLNEGGGRSS